MILPSTEIIKPHWNGTILNEVYHSQWNSISSSGLKSIVDSPYAFYKNLQNAQLGIKKAASDSMNFGTLIHTAILEYDVFKKKIVLSPKFDKRTKQGKSDFEEFEASLDEDAIILTQDKYDEVAGIVEAVRDHKEARFLLSEGISEVSGFYNDPETGIQCRIRPDFMTSRSEFSMFIDLKTAQSSDYRKFQNQIVSYNYSLQMAMYREGIEIITGKAPEICAFIVIENKFPFEIAIYTASDELLSRGKEMYRYALNRLKKCIDENNFPMRQHSAQEMILPQYEMNKETPTIEDANE
jgi:hypothetical protein